jgi:phosphatidylglycerophosphate synthase
MTSEHAVRRASANGRTSAYRDALARLNGAQKPGAGEPAYLRWVNRGLGKRVAAAASIVGIRPNTVTTASAALSLAGFTVIVVASHLPIAAVLATVLLLAGYALDSADGQLARLTGTGSHAGEWLDHVVDATRTPLAHAAILLALTRREAPDWLLGVCLAFLVIASVWFFSQTLADQLERARRAGRPAPADSGSAPAWVSFAKLPADTAALAFVVLSLPWLPLFAGTYTALMLFTAVFAVASLRRKYRSLSADAP